MLFKFKKRITISLFIINFFLISCSSLPANIAGNFTQTFKAFSSLIYGYEDYPISQSLVDEIPYASLKMKIGKGPAGLLILESVDIDEYTWVSADNIYITTKNGRIVRAQGLPNNLVDFFSSEPSFSDILNNDHVQDHFRSISLDNPEVFDMKLEVSYRTIGSEDILILNKERELVLIEEDVENSYIRWKYTNRYWVDKKTGFVWQSIQEIAPNIPPVLIQITKKPS